MATDWTSIFYFITALAPIIDQVIILVEKLLKKSSGPEKKEAAVKTIKAFLPPSFESIPDINEIISNSVDQRVALYNNSGKFKHRSK